ncbi:MAG: hypothetical protein U9N46_01860 [Euryarchaeota archaeon]|nr:hypothetical protein [Euryarchaeota archaeon]
MAGAMRFMCMPGRMPGNVGVYKRVTLVGDGADVVTVWGSDRGVELRHGSS